MSAYIVSQDTIDYIVAAAARYRLNFYAPLPADSDPMVLAATPWNASSNTHLLNWHGHANVIANVLAAQNVRSVNYRYPNADADTFDPLTFDALRSVPCSEIEPVVLFKSIACLRYQSCETPDYELSFAHAILVTIERAAIAHLPGYSDAPWGWTREWDEQRKSDVRARIAASMNLH